MLLGRIAGTVVATRKEPLMEGWRLLVVQQLGVDNEPTGGYVVGVDTVGRRRRRGRALRVGLVGAPDRGHARPPVRRGDHGDRRHLGARRLGGLPQVAMVDEREIQDIIERTRRRVGGPGPQLARQAAVRAELSGPAAVRTGDGVYATLDEAVAAASAAYRASPRLDLGTRKAMIAAVRAAALDQAEVLARMAVEETGLGRVDDKTTKNRLVARKAPGPEDLEVEAVTGTDGMMITEFAPFGVVGAITPVTNPAVTVINNSISIVSAGNAVVFNPHPSARRVSNAAVRLVSKAIADAGGPPDFVVSTVEPTIESARALMTHPDVRLLIVTGGPGVVREALKTDKRAITAGPGNPPAVVDETADVEKAGADIVRGASFDNNIVCTDEKEVFVVASVADRLVRSMAQNGAYVLAEHELRRLERVIFTELGEPGKPGHINPAWIGRDAARILAEIGVRPRWSRGCWSPRCRWTTAWSGPSR